MQSINNLILFRSLVLRACDISSVVSSICLGTFFFFSGGFNLEGHPIVSFPPECTPDFEQYSAGDLLHLLQYYVRIAGLKISVLLNMREKWTESGITKVITVFDELQVSVNLIT